MVPGSENPALPAAAAQLAAEWLPFLMVLLGGVAAWLAFAAHQGVDQPGGWVCRRLRLAGAIQVTACAARLAEATAGLSSSPPVLAFHSLLDISLLVVILYGLRRLAKNGLIPPRRVALLAVCALTALFWGLMGGGPGQPLLQSSPVAVGLQLGFYLLAGTFLMQTVTGSLRSEKAVLRRELSDLKAVNGHLRDQAGQVRQLAAEASLRCTEYLEEARRDRRRAQALEDTLAAAAELGATRSLPNLQNRIVAAVREDLGFPTVVLRLLSAATDTFEARAFAGVEDGEKAGLAAYQISSVEFGGLAAEGSHLSDSFFVRRADLEPAGSASAPGLASARGAVAATEGAGLTPPRRGTNGREGPAGKETAGWHPDDVLVVPLVSTGGETLGFLEVFDAAGAPLPDSGRVRQLELLARHAASAVESAQTYDLLAAKNRELAHAAELVKGLGDMKSNFVANVGHELRTPLTSIAAYTEILRSGGGAMPVKVRDEFLRVIARESEKLTAVIDDLLDLARMEGGDAGFELRETDLADLVQKLEVTVLREAMSKEVGFQTDLPAGEIRLDADPVLVQQLLEHLTANALKFTPPGGSVTLRLEDRSHEVRVVVQDSGIGIPAGKLGQIFERFYQVDDSSTREHGGQGVGLALCRDIVRYHDGRIWAENVLPRGARFTVILPRRPHVVGGLAAPGAVPLPLDPAEFPERLVQWIAACCEVETVSVLVPEPDEDVLTILAACGLPESVVQSTRVRKGSRIAGRVWATGRSLCVSDVTADGRLGKRTNDASYLTRSVLSVPLRSGGEVTGVVNVNNRTDGRPVGPDDQLLLEALAPSIAFLVNQYRQHAERSGRFVALQDAVRQMANLRRHHHDRITSVCHRICLAAARELSLPDQELEHLAVALRCHDVAMRRLPDNLHRKDGPLSTEELQQIRNHVTDGLEILAPLELPAKVRQIILHHHERFDGEGYPDGLEGEAIPIGARLVALADGLDAMLHGRPYRPARTVAESLAEIEDGTAGQFCPRVTVPFLAAARERAGELTRLQGELEGAKARTPAAVESVPTGCI